MFGFERGAFTDARRAKPGLFQAANRGTIFLDEVALLSEGLQAKLLKVLEERSVRRLGSTRDEPIDVILTATNEDLKAAIHTRRFREDLYHRLAVLTLTLPPLRARRRRPVARRALSGPSVRRLQRVAEDADGRGARGAARVRVAGERPRARQSDGACRAAVVRGGRDDGGARTHAGRRVGPGARAGAGPARRARSTTPCATGSSRCWARRAGTFPALPRCSGSHATPCARASRSTGSGRGQSRRRLHRRGPSGARRGPRRRSPPRRRRRRPRSPPRPRPHCCGERRRVTMLRAALAAPEAPEALLETNRALELLRDKIRSFGGTIEGRSPTGSRRPSGSIPPRTRRAGRLTPRWRS